MQRVAESGCVICGRPAECHHPRYGAGMGQKASHFDVIGLCEIHHRTGGYGTAFHAGKKSFESRFGTERELLAETRRRLGLEV